MSLEVRDLLQLFDRLLAADLVIVGTASGPVRIERLEGFDAPRVAGFFEIQVEQALLGDPPSERLLLRVLGDGSEDNPTWTTDLRPDSRVLLLLSRDVAPELPENLFTPYFSSAFPVDDADRVAFPADVLDDESRRLLEPERGRAALDRVRKLVETAWGERAERERELEELIPRTRIGRYPEVLEMPAAVARPEGPLGPGGPPFRPDEPAAGRDATPETASDETEPERQSPRQRRQRRSN